MVDARKHHNNHVLTVLFRDYLLLFFTWFERSGIYNLISRLPGVLPNHNGINSFYQNWYRPELSFTESSIYHMVEFILCHFWQSSTGEISHLHEI